MKLPFYRSQQPRIKRMKISFKHWSWVCSVTIILPSSETYHNWNEQPHPVLRTAALFEEEEPTSQYHDLHIPTATVC